MDRTIDLAGLEANFDQLVEEVAIGTTLVITRDGVTVAKLVPAEPPTLKLGFLEGTMPPIPDAAMFEPMTTEELAEWENGQVFPESPQKRTREFDFLRDELPHVPDAAFFDPMSAEELAEWEDGPVSPAQQPARDRRKIGGRYFAPASAFFDPLPEEELAAWEGTSGVGESLDDP